MKGKKLMYRNHLLALLDTTGQGLAEKLIEVIEKNFGLEEDSERCPSFNPGEKTLRQYSFLVAVTASIFFYAMEHLQTEKV